LHGPGGGEELNIVEDQTDRQGRVSTVLTSGTRSGVAQIIASTEYNGRTITAEPVRIVIHAGLPVQDSYYMWPDRINYPVPPHAGMSVWVQMGDRYQNPVQQGTAVYFTTTAGIVQAESWTNLEGIAEVTFWGHRNQEDEIFGPGFGYITGSTLGESGTIVTDSMLILVSEEPIITVAPDGAVNLNAGDRRTFNLTVADINGNPMARGQQISVSLIVPPQHTGEEPYKILHMGDTNITMHDTQNPAHAEFIFSVDLAGNESRNFPFTVRIQTSGPNGTAVKNLLGQAN
jgi:hypothetical protein